MSRLTAIVTGAGAGIGAGIAIRLAKSYDLILTHLTHNEDLHHVRRQAETTGATVTTIGGDLTDSATLDQLWAAADQAGEHLAVLVSNAGTYPRLHWTSLDIDTFRRQVEINLVTHAACAKIATPAMIARGYGRIIAISSVLTQVGRTDLAGYIAAKSGLEGLVRALARELGADGVTVNCVRAGSIEVTTEHDVVDDHEAMIRRQLARQCIQRRGQPHDIAAAVEFLASHDAGFITGQCLTVDGGWYLT